MKTKQPGPEDLMTESDQAVGSAASKAPSDWPPDSERRRLFHPSSGVWILALDWMIFGGTALTAGLATLVTMSAGFVLGGLGTALCQWHFAADSPAKALAKGLFGGLLVGVPLPIAGSFAGTIILALSGLKGPDPTARKP